jgi:hypothetical protein
VVINEPPERRQTLVMVPVSHRCVVVVPNPRRCPFEFVATRGIPGCKRCCRTSVTMCPDRTRSPPNKRLQQTGRTPSRVWYPLATALGGDSLAVSRPAAEPRSVRQLSSGWTGRVAGSGPKRIRAILR